MNYIVLDLEWNQASDMDTKLASPLLFEIIEIGAVKLNKAREQIDTFHELIKPQVFRRMNQTTGELIHIRIDQLRNCRTFAEVILDFLDWCGEDAIFCTWGDLDLFELQRNMDFYHMQPLADRPIPYYDIQKLFSIAFEGKKKRRSLEYAIDFLNLKKNVPFHRADSDAFYTAKVMQKLEGEALLQNYSYDIYRVPKEKKDEVRIIFADYEKYISRAFADRNEVLEDREVIATKCYKCKRNIKKKIKWFTMNNGRHYYCICCCDKHGYIKGKIRIKKTLDNQVYVVKTMKYVNQSDVEELLRRRERAKITRREREKRVKENKRQEKKI